MNFQLLKRGCLVVAMVQGFGILPLAAQLPILNEKEWLGYFTGFETRKVRWSFSSDGKSVLRVVGDKGALVSDKLSIPVEFVVEETTPDGKTAVRGLIPESLESAQAPTTKPKGVVIHAKVRGDVAVELTIDEDSGKLSVGGRVLDPGPTVKNPLKFSIRVRFPNAYPDDSPTADKKKAKAFEAKTKNDRIQLIRVDKSRGKQSLSEAVEADAATALNGPGIAMTEIEIGGYKDRKFQLVATENSLMNLTGLKPGPMSGGFVIAWSADSAKDPQGKARLIVEVK